jgi:hypothetical protein
MKRKAHQNIRKPGNSDKFEPVKRKRNNRLRPVSTDAGAVVTDNPLWLFAYAAILFVGMWVAKLIL